MRREGESIRDRLLHVHLLPELASPERLAGAVAVVIDVLRATTTIIHALAAGCCSVRPIAEVDDARALANSMRAGKVILAGERGGERLPGFDRGNSPCEFETENCHGCTLVLTTTNGTKAMLRAAAAERIMLAAFVNYSAVCEQLLADERPLHIVCAGSDGEPSLEDSLLAGAFIEHLCDYYELQLNDSARMAWDCFENQSLVLHSALELGRGGQTLVRLGFGDDIAAAAEVDRFAIVPELKRDPLRVEVGSAGVVRNRWPR